MFKDDYFFMKHALRLAKKGRGFTKPNPMVGAVIVQSANQPEIIGEGYHRKYGEDHAEVAAIKDCLAKSKTGGNLIKGASMYVTLEPCCHHGKTPPCTKAIIHSGIKKVFIACKDPSKKAAGKGVKTLKAAGIEVEMMEKITQKAKSLNKHFFTFHEKNRPFITLKIAISLDGKVAEKRGVQTWLTGEKAKKYVSKLRQEHEAILIGTGTASTDNPHLGPSLRVILTGKRKLPKNLKIFRDKNHLILKNKTVKQAIKELYKRGITSVLVEGGPSVFTNFLKANLADEIHFLIAPKILGPEALHFIDSKKINLNKISLSTRSVQKLDSDTLVIATLQ
jgi:diaminohydroxyphosphoribosylaminopyrimidine deaminase / 5-amino-6-(5-phosphoribosylamino)uracil reductase